MPGPEISSVLSGRDRLLIVAFVLVNIAVVLGVVFLRGGDSDEKSRTPIPRAGRVVENLAIGAQIRRPRGWKVERGPRTIVMRSPDSSTIMSISEPPGAKRGRDVVRTAERAIREQYRRVRSRPLRGEVAGLPTTSRVVSATNKHRVRVNILVAAPQGRTRTWLVEVFSGPGARTKRLPEAQVALGTLRLRG